MDESFSALDPMTCHELRYLLKHVIQEQETTVMHITHNLQDVWSLANKTAVLYNGELLQFGKKEEIFQKPNCKVVADFVESSLFEGVVVKQNHDTSLVRLNDIVLYSRDKAEVGKEVKIAIRPENIGVSKYRPTENNINVIESHVREIESHGEMGSLLLDAGKLTFTVRSTTSTLFKIAPKPHDIVYAYIDYEHVHIVRDI